MCTAGSTAKDGVWTWGLPSKGYPPAFHSRSKEPGQMSPLSSNFGIASWHQKATRPSKPHTDWYHLTQLPQLTAAVHPASRSSKVFHEIIILNQRPGEPQLHKASTCSLKAFGSSSWFFSHKLGFSTSSLFLY